MKILEQTHNEREYIRAGLFLISFVFFVLAEFLFNCEIFMVQQVFPIAVSYEQPKRLWFTMEWILPYEISS